MGTARCLYCGNESPEDSEKCIHCGAPLHQARRGWSRNARRNFLVFFVVFAVFVGLMMLVLPR
jgi:predicted nucleic acid-binding Zn ribbon protein